MPREEPTEVPVPTARPTRAPTAPPTVHILRSLTIESIDGGSGGDYRQITSDFGNWIGPDKKILFRLNPLASSEQEAVRAVRVTFSDGQIEESSVSTINLARPPQTQNPPPTEEPAQVPPEPTIPGEPTPQPQQNSRPIPNNKYGIQIDVNELGKIPSRSQFATLNPGWARFVYRYFSDFGSNLPRIPSGVKTLVIFNNESTPDEIEVPLGSPNLETWKRYIDDGFVLALQYMLQTQSGIDAIEIWNEEDVGEGGRTSWVPPEAYAYMLKESAAVIKKHNPSIKVIMGGLNSGGISYVQRMKQVHPDVFANVDAIGLHPYFTSPKNWCTQEGLPYE